MTLPSGSQVYVVAGGSNYEGYPVSSEIFDLSSQTWSPGPDLPFPVLFATSVPFGDTFLVVGGIGDGEYLQSILEFDPVANDWIVRPERLSVGRDDRPAITVVDSDYIDCV